MHYKISQLFSNFISNILNGHVLSKTIITGYALQKIKTLYL